MEYLIKQKVFSFVRTFNVLDVNGNNLYTVKRNFGFIRKMRILDLTDKEIARWEKHFFFREYKIFQEEKEVGLLRRKGFSLRPNFNLVLKGQEYSVKGDFFGHNFQICKQDKEIVKITKKIFSWADTYSIVIDDNEDQVVFLAVVMAVESSCHAPERKRSTRTGLAAGVIGTLMDQ